MPVTAEQIRVAAFSNLTGEPLYDASLIAQVHVMTRADTVSDIVDGIVRAAHKNVSNQFLSRITKDDLSGQPSGVFVTARLSALRSSMKALIDGWAQKTGGKLEEFLIRELENLTIKSSDAARLALGYAIRAETAPEPVPDAAASMRAYEAKVEAGSVDAGETTAALRWSVASPQPHILLSLASASPIKGHIMSEWIDQWTSTAKFNVSAALTQGFAAGETPAQIARRVRQVGEFSAAAARTLVRTSFASVSAVSREMLFGENRDIIGSVIWVSKLDSHTTPICRELDNRVFKIGQGLRPPAHYNCRSTVAPIMKPFDEIFGDQLEAFKAAAAAKASAARTAAVQAASARTAKAAENYGRRGFPHVGPKGYADIVDGAPLGEQSNRALGAYKEGSSGPINRLLDETRPGSVHELLADSDSISSNVSSLRTSLKLSATSPIAPIPGSMKRETQVWARHVSDLDAAMTGSRVKRDCMLYRGMSRSALHFPPEVNSVEAMLGREFSVLGYCSASTDPEVANEFSDIPAPGFGGALTNKALVSIRVPKGVRALNFYDDQEHEVLLDRGFRFRVIKARLSGNTISLTVDVVGYDDRRNNFASLLARKHIYTPPDDGPGFNDVDRRKDVVDTFAAASATSVDSATSD